ncbi:MAG TPA: DUF5788 family protein [Candidatus Acidoferrales bacterium]|nr:DUF5788 family protein [Candidatus Acidoferrales bacterium]
MSHEAWGVNLSGTEKLTTQERKKILQKLNRLFIFIGCEVPTKIEVDGETIPLHELIWKIVTSKEPISSEELASIDKLYRDIEKRIREEELKIKSADITKIEARELYVETCGLIRAVLELRDIEKSGLLRDYSAQVVPEMIESQKNWLEYLKKIR